MPHGWHSVAASTCQHGDCASTEPDEPPVAVEPPVVAAVVDEPPALLIQIDLRAWRSRFFWRLVASVVVRRLGRRCEEPER
jgi:hypothetical protein